jgi:hypothetical protein
LSRLVASTASLDILDMYLASEARRLNKTTGGLEPAEYNCRVRIDSFPLVDLVKVLISDLRIKAGNSVPIRGHAACLSFEEISR